MFFLRLFLLLTFCINFISPVYPQTEEKKEDSTYKDLINLYDEIINKNKNQMSATSPGEIRPKEDELILLLPDLNGPLFKGWLPSGDLRLWINGSTNELNKDKFFDLSDELINDFKIEKVLKREFENEDNSIELSIYKLENPELSFSLYSILSNGKPSSLMIGGKTSESENRLTFWNGRYCVDVNIKQNIENRSKQFAVLLSQDISKNINDESIPPGVLIKMPSLNKIPGSEKLCFSNSCFMIYSSKDFFEFDSSVLNISSSKGAIAAEYNKFDSKKENKTKIFLVLIEYNTNDIAEGVFNSLKSIFSTKSEQDKKIKISEDEKLIKVKFDEKEIYTMFKQKENLVAIAFNLSNEEDGKRLLNLIEWPSSNNQ